jgi:hypothetical protein
MNIISIITHPVFADLFIYFLIVTGLVVSVYYISDLALKQEDDK